jgi:hypothetical protein
MLTPKERKCDCGLGRIEKAYWHGPRTRRRDLATILYLDQPSLEPQNTNSILDRSLAILKNWQIKG